MIYFEILFVFNHNVIHVQDATGSFITLVLDNYTPKVNKSKFWWTIPKKKHYSGNCFETSLHNAIC